MVDSNLANMKYILLVFVLPIRLHEVGADLIQHFFSNFMGEEDQGTQTW